MIRPLLACLLLACAAPVRPAAVVVVPVHVECLGGHERSGRAIVAGPRQVVTVAHVVDCDDGAPWRIVAGGAEVREDAREPGAVRLVAVGVADPWRDSPVPVFAPAVAGLSGEPALTADGRVLGLVEDRIPDAGGYVRAVAGAVRRLVEGASRVSIEGDWP